MARIRAALDRSLKIIMIFRTIRTFPNAFQGPNAFTHKAYKMKEDGGMVRIFLRTCCFLWFFAGTPPSYLSALLAVRR